MPLEYRKSQVDQLSPPESSGKRTGAGGWHRISLRVLLILFCFEVGVFLLLLPWLDSWEKNYLAYGRLHSVWANSYFRGAISGLGVVNIYIALAELANLLRPSRAAEDDAGARWAKRFR
jgi:hypothetical protein